jgi:hypothetical protein
MLSKSSRPCNAILARSGEIIPPYAKKVIMQRNSTKA